MKVIINNKIYDAEKEPIILILSDSDKINIQNMGKRIRYFACPDKMTNEEINIFVRKYENIK